MEGRPALRETALPGPGCGPLIMPAAGPERGLRAQIFDRIRASGLIPRVDLARELGISPASVTAITSELIERGLIAERDDLRPSGDTARGRPPVSLSVRGSSGFVAGIKLSSESHSAIILDFAGTRIGSASVPARLSTKTLMGALDGAEDALGAACKAAGITPSALGAVAVGVPGVVNAERGTVAWSPLIADRDAPLGARLAARIGCPVLVDNDANMLTLAELWFGAGRTLADFVVVTIEHGVGMGLVQNHRVYRGAGGMGMEIGHTKVELDGALCRCGQRGCLEAYVADYALVREASTALGGLPPAGGTHAQLEMLFNQAKAGNEAAKMIFARAARYLAVGLSTIVNLFDPPRVILSGERMRYDFLYAGDMVAEMERLTLSSGRAMPKVEINTWDDLVWAQGAGALALSHASDLVLAAS